MQIKDRQQLLVTAAIAVVVLFAGDKLVVSPLTAAWKSRHDEILKLRAQVDQGKKLLLREKGIRNYWREISSRSLTNDDSAAQQRVVQAINTWAQESRVALAGINPTWKHDSEDYSTFECHVDATGDLGQLTRFIYGAEREPLALKFQSIELGARDKEGRQLSLGLQFSGLILTPPRTR